MGPAATALPCLVSAAIGAAAYQLGSPLESRSAVTKRSPLGQLVEAQAWNDFSGLKTILQLFDA
jgi:hypothetical protein